MRLPSYRRIFKTDFAEEYQPLVEKLAVSINNGFDTVYNALNKNLTFDDNILSTIATFSVSVDSSGNPTKKNTQFKLSTNQNSVQGVIVLNCFELNTGAPPPNAVFVSFTKNESNVIINNITGLLPDKIYSLKVLAIS